MRRRRRTPTSTCACGRSITRSGYSKDNPIARQPVLARQKPRPYEGYSFLHCVSDMRFPDPRRRKDRTSWFLSRRISLPISATSRWLESQPNTVSSSGSKWFYHFRLMARFS